MRAPSCSRPMAWTSAPKCTSATSTSWAAQLAASAEPVLVVLGLDGTPAELERDPERPISARCSTMRATARCCSHAPAHRTAPARSSSSTRRHRLTFYPGYSHDQSTLAPLGARSDRRGHAAPACSSGQAAQAAADAAVTLLNVSYDATRELYEAINPLFIAHWLAHDGGRRSPSCRATAAPDSRPRAIINGLPADVATLGSSLRRRCSSTSRRS